MSCIMDGMRNDSSFVRNAFIDFAIRVVPFMQRIVAATQLIIHVKQLIKVYCQLLKHSDVS